MTKEKLVWHGVVIGWSLDSAFHSLFQDFVGQEGYINLVRNHWISGWYTVPGALLLLAMGILAWVGVVVAPEGK